MTAARIWFDDSRDTVRWVAESEREIQRCVYWYQNEHSVIVSYELIDFPKTTRGNCRFNGTPYPFAVKEYGSHVTPADRGLAKVTVTVPIGFEDAIKTYAKFLRQQ